MLKDIYRNLLIEINEDVNRDGLIKTPERAAKALEYLVSGYNRDTVSYTHLTLPTT